MSDNECSDDELREILALKGPGLYREEAPKKQHIPINKAGLEAALVALTKRHLPWLERLDVTLSAETLATDENVNEESSAPADPKNTNSKTNRSNDDFKREALFQRQAATAACFGLKRLHDAKVPVQRPVNYLAEMAKTDNHMRKVRETLVTQQRQVELREKARSLRESRKFGKKVQKEVKAKKQEERSEFLRAVKSYKKGKLDSGQLDELLGGKGRSATEINDQLKQATTKSKTTGTGGKTSAAGNKKRAFKNKRYGFGGQKKRSKYNTKESSGGFARDFSVSKHNSTPLKASKMAALAKKTPSKGKRRKSGG